MKALAWLADDLNARWLGLKARETINTCATLIPANPGDVAHATFGALGEVSITFEC